jgi:predicted dinucleotide-binding enzyme
VKIGLLGTGNLARALGGAWAATGHTIAVTGRDIGRAESAAKTIGAAATAVEPAALAAGTDVVVLAVSWTGIESALTLIGGPQGKLAGTIILDCTNPVDFATGRLELPSGSAAEIVARTAPGAHVTKALHLFPSATWPFTGNSDDSPVVPIYGDDSASLERVRELVGDLGSTPVVVGGLDAARQAEEVAGFVTRVAIAGVNPRLAVPDLS